ncbi:Phosphoribosylglycinamide formyltransferase 2 [hydrothermal vent metagenome]|uniref:Phosphoribosylglycinamide formyltransferase 2 n=1 Tax=hydrothermal vent metagenome TaxID=652676 RepID=A0A3B1CMT3_9ZZZZ
MIKIGTPLKSNAIRVLLCGAGELGKELSIEFQRLGIEVIAVDRYVDAPAMQVAHRAYVIDMLDGKALRKIIEKEQPHYVVPEIEAIATDELLALEKEGFHIVPTARATHLTMDREGIRRLATETLKLPTSDYRFAETELEYRRAVAEIGRPCVVKPVMSSSGKGQSVVRSENDIEKAWQYAQAGGRAGAGRVIVETLIPFDYEITLLTIKAVDGIHFCDPIGHRQEAGDYRESWQPQAMTVETLKLAQDIARTVVENLSGRGIYGVEFFIKGDQVYFSEVSPRPHDTGMVTLISQNLSEFALHVRAILGLPIGRIETLRPSASAVILGEGVSSEISYDGLEKALAVPNTQIRLFGKPEINGCRRLGIALASAESSEEAVSCAKHAAECISVNLS